MQARSAAHRPDVRVARMDLIDRSLPVYTYEDRSGRDNWTVARGALGDGGARWLPIKKPDAYAGEVFQTLLAAQGHLRSFPKKLRKRHPTLHRLG